MMEVEWLTSTDYLPMLIYLRGEVVQAEQIKQWLHCQAGRLAWGEAERVGKRKLSLVSIEMCRNWHDLPVEGISRHFLKAYEKLSSDESTWGEMPDTPLGVDMLGNALAWDVSEHLAKDSAAEFWKHATEDERFEWGFFGIGPPDPLWQMTHKGILDGYPQLLRKIIGNPYSQPAVDPHWLNSKVRLLAEAIYHNQTFNQLPSLADALEETGCRESGILGHCRSPGPHVRGCWVVDALLGRE